MLYMYIYIKTLHTPGMLGARTLRASFQIINQHRGLSMKDVELSHLWSPCLWMILVES